METFFGRCCKESGRSVMPGNMWSRTVRDVRDNRSKDDDYKTCWKLISRSEYQQVAASGRREFGSALSVQTLPSTRHLPLTPSPPAPNNRSTSTSFIL